MSSSDLIRWGGLAALVGGAAWIVEGLLTLVGPEQGPEAVGSPYSYPSNVVFVIAFIGTLGGLVGLHALQAPSYGKIGRAGFVAAFVGVAFMLVAVVLSIVAAGLSIGVVDWIFGIAFLVHLVGFVLYGAATLQAKVLPRWGGVALIIALPVSIVLSGYGGNALFGLMWLALGYVLWSQRGATPEQPSRVS
jgi:hypothetical protein